MNADISVNGRPWHVAIEKGEQSGDVLVVVKDRSRQMNASWIDAETLSLIERSSAREVRFQRRPDGTLVVTFDGRSFDAVVHDARLKPRPTDSVGSVSIASVPPAGPDFSHAVRAPMPGRIVRVLVAVGDRVSARQGVVVVEAMKMENELRSTRDGVVKEVNVRQGAAIEAGAVLVVIE